MKRLVSLSMVLLLFAGCASMQGAFGGAQPQAAAPKQMPDVVQDEFRKGLAAYQNEQYVNAEEHFQNVIRLNPYIPEAQINLALALYQQGKTAHAEKHFEEARRLYKDEIGMGSRSQTPRPRRGTDR